MTDRYAHSLFCDDTRQETSGKWIYIGVYSSKVLVQAFPATLPSFVVVLTVVAPATRPIKELRVRVVKDEEEILSGSFGLEALAEIANRANSDYRDDIDERMLQLQTQFRFSPLQLDKPCDLKVRVDTEEEELKAGSIEVREIPPSAAPHKNTSA